MSDTDLRLLAWAQNIAMGNMLMALAESGASDAHRAEFDAMMRAHEAFLSWSLAHEADDAGLDFSDAVIADAVKRWNR